MVGKILAQYQICEKIGEGGMGVVWKARDTHLDRFVALKTLPAERLADCQGRFEIRPKGGGKSDQFFS
jgi:hypothetical protein